MADWMFINALARGSAMECLAGLDVCGALEISDSKRPKGKSAVNAGGCYGNENVPAGRRISFTSACRITESIAPFRGFPHTIRYAGG